MNSRILIIFLLLVHQFLLSQNLVPNNGFEEYKRCPKEEGELKRNVIHWKIVNKASPDYFNSCSLDKIVNTPSNAMGSQLPHLGDAYVGIIVHHKIQNFREYIQCELTKPLKKEKDYCCSFYISLADKSGEYTDKMGMLLSKKRIKGSGLLVVSKSPQIENKKGFFIDNKKDWLLICDTFKSKGDERYITIGNFFNDDETEIKIVNNIKELRKKYPSSYYNSIDNAYYYIDDVSIVEITDSTPCNCNQIKNDTTPLVTREPIERPDTISPKIGKKTVFKNLVFETNKSEILPASYEELNKLSNHLFKNVQFKIELSGHTDNVGKEEDNQKLSEARTKAVANYLISKGILQERISYKGYGSTKPLTTNDTEAGRLLNRRVEFIIK